MSTPESIVHLESLREETSHTVRKHRSAVLPRRQSSNITTQAHPYAQRASPHQSPRPRPSIITSPTNRDARLSRQRTEDTDFKYIGSIEQYGWKAGQVPLFLEWYPEKLDRRSTLKFFENGREYVIGRSPTCDIFFQNSEPDSGISAQHLKIKTVLVPGPVNKIFVWVTDRSTNGTYVNGERIPQGEPWKLSPDDHVTLLKRDNASDSRPNIGFRVIMALQKPRLEDHYQILKGDLLGSGTFGSVHKARNIKTGKIAAVKIIRSLRGSSLSQDLEREIRIMRKLDHPNIVQFHDSFEETKDHDITRYIVMEFVEGGTLHEFIQTSPQMSEATVRHIIRQILSALEYMHDHRRVSHRDLKPANILLCNRGTFPTVKIADLGLAKIEAASKNNTFCGSPGYLAPECTQGPQPVGLNKAMDIYAVGVITFELLTGKRPFGTDMKKDPYTRQIPSQLLRNRKCSDEAIEFIFNLLTMDPTERPSAQDCMGLPWMSGESMYKTTPLRDQKILPPTEIIGSPSKTIRATPRLSSPDSEDSFGSSSSSSPPSSSSESDDDRSPTITKTPSKQVIPSFFSDRMDICSMRSATCIREPSFIRTASPMNIDTMSPAQKVWCILSPLPGNVVGTTTLFLTKPTNTLGSDVRADIVLRHTKIADHHCTIVAGTYNKQKGLSGMIHIHDKKSMRFQHGAVIYALEEGDVFVGYTVEFPAVAEEKSVTMAMRGLNITTPRSSKRRENHFFAPYTPKRRAVSDSMTMRPISNSQTETVPVRRTASVKQMGTPKAKTQVGEINGTLSGDVQQAWGALVSKTKGLPDIMLFRNSTGLGRICSWVDVDTGERGTQYSCRVYKSRNGDIGIKAVKPVLVDDKRIIDGQSMLLQNNQTISLLEEDFSIITEYTMQIYAQ